MASTIMQTIGNRHTEMIRKKCKEELLQKVKVFNEKIRARDSFHSQWKMSVQLWQDIRSYDVCADHVM